MLSDEELERFGRDGFVAVRQAVPADIVGACRAELDDELRAQGVDPDDATTWTEPVVRFWCPDREPFARAGSQRILWETYDQLIGPDRHRRKRAVGGSVPARFPSERDPGDAGWHVDGTIPIGDTWGLNVHSRWRGLLCLFLFSDIGPDDAPTEIKVGSHLLVPPSIAALGPDGGLYDLHATDVFDRILDLPSAFATGQAGDVFVCHPFGSQGHLAPPGSRAPAAGPARHRDRRPIPTHRGRDDPSGRAGHSRRSARPSLSRRCRRPPSVWAVGLRTGGHRPIGTAMTATDQTATDEAARRLALARFDAGLARLGARERERRAGRSLWLAHHWPEHYGERCVMVAGRPVCRRCLALHPLSLAVAFASAAGLAPWPAALDPWPIWLLSIPATLAYGAEALGVIPYRPRWQVATTLIAAFAFGRGLGYELVDRWHPYFWGPLAVFGALWFWATAFAAGRRRAAQRAATASTSSSSLL
ncbi:MAG: hypothetical protein AAGK32_06690 [Actinomycetota bacterium]